MRLGDELERARLCIDHVLLAADRPERVVRRLELCRRVPSKHSDVARLSFETTARCGAPLGTYRKAHTRMSAKNAA